MFVRCHEMLKERWLHLLLPSSPPPNEFLGLNDVPLGSSVASFDRKFPTPPPTFFNTFPKPSICLNLLLWLFPFWKFFFFFRIGIVPPKNVVRLFNLWPPASIAKATYVDLFVLSFVVFFCARFVSLLFPHTHHSRFSKKTMKFEFFIAKNEKLAIISDVF